LVQNREFFIPHLYLALPQVVTRQNFVKMFDAGKTRMIGVQYGETSSYAVAKMPRDASCLSVVSFYSTKRRVSLLLLVM